MILFFFLLSNASFAQSYQTFTGKVINKATQKPIPYAYLTIPSKGIGTATNSEGDFKFIIPKILLDYHVDISVIGFKNFTRKAADFDSTTNIFQLDSVAKEILYKVVDGKQQVKDAIIVLKNNYPVTPTYQQGYYLESTEMGGELGFVKINEGILRIERQNDEKNQLPDKIKLLRGRKYEWTGQTAKLDGFGFMNGAAVVTRTLEGDGPDYLAKSNINDYNFKVDSLLTFFDERPVYAINFSPANKRIKAPRNGTIFIDTTSKAIIRIEYEMTPEGVQDIIKGGLFSNIKKKGKAIRAFNDYRILGDKWQLQDSKITFELEFEDKLDKKYKIDAKIDLHFIATESLKLGGRTSIKDEEILLTTDNFPKGGIFDDRPWGNFNHLVATEKMKEIVKKMLGKK